MVGGALEPLILIETRTVFWFWEVSCQWWAGALESSILIERRTVFWVGEVSFRW